MIKAKQALLVAAALIGMAIFGTIGKDLSKSFAGKYSEEGIDKIVVETASKVNDHRLKPVASFYGWKPVIGRPSGRLTTPLQSHHPDAAASDS